MCGRTVHCLMKSVHCRIMALPAASAGWALPAMISCIGCRGRRAGAAAGRGRAAGDWPACRSRTCGRSPGSARWGRTGMTGRSRGLPGCRRSVLGGSTCSLATAMSVRRLISLNVHSSSSDTWRMASLTPKGSPSQRSLPHVLVHSRSASRSPTRGRGRRWSHDPPGSRRAANVGRAAGRAFC